MSRLIPVLLLILFSMIPVFAVDDYQLTATWVSPGNAEIRWMQPAETHRTCLFIYYGATYPSGICRPDDPPAGEVVIELPGTFTDPAYAPADGNRYVLWVDGQPVSEAFLGVVAPSATPTETSTPTSTPTATPTPGRDIRLPLVIKALPPTATPTPSPTPTPTPRRQWLPIIRGE